MKLAKSSHETLNLEKIKLGIGVETLQLIPQIVIFKRINSTNTYLSENADDLTSGTICLAEHQTQGRGRFDRTWVSAPGESIACSILWKFKGKQDLQGLSLSIGVMTVHALARAGIKDLSLKWPNDIYFRDKKLGGILIQCQVKSDAVYAVIGIGINLHSSNPAWSSIEEITKTTPQKNVLVATLINEVISGLVNYEHTGFASYYQSFSQLDYLCGQEVNVINGESIITGMMDGIDRQANLILKKQDGRCLKFSSGEVSVRLRTDLK